MGKLMGKMAVFFVFIFTSFISYGEETKLYTKEEIIAMVPPGEVPGEENENRWDLVYALPIYNYPFFWTHFVTLHRSQKEADKLCIYKRIDTKDGIRYQLSKCLRADEGLNRFGEIRCFSWSPKNRKSVVWFLHVPLFYSGTGHFRKDWIFFFDKNELNEVAFQPAPEWFKDKLNKGEGIWKGEHNDFNSERLYFSSCIWKSGDGNGGPSAGFVEGTYDIIAEEVSIDGSIFNKKWKMNMVVDKYERFPIEKIYEDEKKLYR